MAPARPLRYVVVEGPIGVGKTSLVTELAARSSGRAVLESFEDNPFLPAFYRDRESHALSTQLFFLMSRFRQQELLAQADLFSPVTVADYLFDKDRLFADLTLGPSERSIYDQLFRVLHPQVARPDLVVHLRADLDALLSRIRARGRAYERAMDPTYLQALAQAYDRFFASYAAAPVVTLDTTLSDPRTGPILDALVAAIRTGVLPGADDPVLGRGGGPDPALPLGER